MAGKAKERLDKALVDRGLVQSRQRAQAMIMAGKVLVDNMPVDKPGAQIKAGAEITVKEPDFPYVSRAALKLEKAVRTLDLSLEGMECLDVGASTGGFTDFMLQNGAKKVYAVDVGYGQIAWKLRQDPRVVVIERMNIRYMPADALEGPVDLVTIDTSFISLKNVVPPTLDFVKPGGIYLALIKPQFEVGKGKVGKGGIVRDPAQHEAVIADLSEFFEGLGLVVGPVTPSPITGTKGNREFIIKLVKP